MDSNNSITSKYTHLNIEDRYKIQIFKKEGLSITAIAKKVGRNKSTVSREIGRNSVIQIDTHLKEHKVYFADTGQAKYIQRRKECGCKIKLVSCFPAIQYIETKIKKDKWSPDAAIGKYKLDHPDKVCITTKTYYNYVDLGIVQIKPIDLLLKVKLKLRTKIVRQNKKKLGESIEKRPEIINNREEAGHWEIDTVIGKREKSSVLMTLTERKTRMEIIKKIPDKTNGSVQQALLELKDTYAGQFNDIFKSITCDNGGEFSFDVAFKEGLSTQFFYTHPYSSFERGTNENHNSIIRRFIPKGRSMDEIEEDVIDRIEYWMNTLPRKILNYKTPLEVFTNHFAMAT